MKKVLCFAAAAMAIFASCQKTEVVYSNDGPQEIALFAVNKTATKAPVSGDDFMGGDDMTVVAYIAEGAIDERGQATFGNFFGPTLFQCEQGATYYTGQPARYWPLTSSTINFLAVTETGGGVDKTSTVFNENYGAGATVTLSDNSGYNQNDLMFAAGQGKHAQGSNYSSVSMVFKHALSWINFEVATTTATGYSIVVNSISLNSAVYQGTLALANANYASTSNIGTSNVEATWTPGTPTAKVYVPNAAGDGKAESVSLTDVPEPFGNGLLVVPNGGAGSFTINYTLTQADNTKNTFDYTYNFPQPVSWEMAKKYTYKINITLSEVEIDPSVEDWQTATAEDVKLDGKGDPAASN